VHADAYVSCDKSRKAAVNASRRTRGRNVSSIRTRTAYLSDHRDPEIRHDLFWRDFHDHFEVDEDKRTGKVGRVAAGLLLRLEQDQNGGERQAALQRDEMG
jgi:hypothetical protein